MTERETENEVAVTRMKSFIGLRELQLKFLENENDVLKKRVEYLERENANLNQHVKNLIAEAA